MKTQVSHVKQLSDDIINKQGVLLFFFFENSMKSNFEYIMGEYLIERDMKISV